MNMIEYVHTRTDLHSSAYIQLVVPHKNSCTFFPNLGHRHPVEYSFWIVLAPPATEWRGWTSPWINPFSSASWCSLDVALIYVRNRSKPVRNRSQPSARLLYGRAYGKFSRRGHFWRFLAGAILMRHFQKMRCSFRGRRSTLDVSIVILRGRHSTLDVSCCVFFANRIGRAASSGDRVQIPWQAWHFVRCDENWRKPRTKHWFWGSKFIIDVPKKTRRKTSILKLQSVKIYRNLARNARFAAPTCSFSSPWFSCGLAVSMGEVTKSLLFEGFQTGCHVVLRGRRGTLWHSNLFDNVSKVSKLEKVSHEMLILLRPHVASRAPGFPVVSPCLWGKLQNLSFSKVFKQVVMSFCVAGVALCYIPTCLMPCRNCQNWRKSRTTCSFCCAHVSRLEPLVFLWPRRVYGGSYKISSFRRFSNRLSCRFAWQAWHFVTFQPVW